MQNNIFENAYFGKQYKTRDGMKAIYRAHHCFHHLFTENAQFVCDDEGYVVNTAIPIPEYDIVSEWHEPINEEELDELASEYAENNHRSYACHDEDTDDWYNRTDKATAKKAYKAGFRARGCYCKVKEE